MKWRIFWLRLDKHTSDGDDLSMRSETFTGTREQADARAEELQRPVGNRGETPIVKEAS